MVSWRPSDVPGWSSRALDSQDYRICRRRRRHVSRPQGNISPLLCSRDGGIHAIHRCSQSYPQVCTTLTFPAPQLPESRRWRAAASELHSCKLSTLCITLVEIFCSCRPQESGEGPQQRKSSPAQAQEPQVSGEIAATGSVMEGNCENPQVHICAHSYPQGWITVCPGPGRIAEIPTAGSEAGKVTSSQVTHTVHKGCGQRPV